MSPVDRCGTRKYSMSRLLWVPLPAPGGPMKINRIASLSRSRAGQVDPTPHSASAGTVRLRKALWFLARIRPYPPSSLALEQSLVISHDQVAVDLLHQIEGHADGDQQ